MRHDPALYRPAASLETLRLRADLLAYTRSFFSARGFWEVETPILSHDVVVDAHLEPFTTRASAATAELFLQTSPEFGMKRLIAAGASAIFQITRAFRRGEVGPRHNPEFTIVEWYRVDATCDEQMDLVENLVAGAFERVRTCCATDPAKYPTTLHTVPPPVPRPFERITYDAAFERAVGRRVIGLAAGELAGIAHALEIEPPASLDPNDVDGWLNLLLAFVVEPQLSRSRSVFVSDYPPGQAALARIRPGTPAVSERFELYLSGIEICNGYSELTDPHELRRRIEVESAKRRRDGNRDLPAQSRLLEAMDAGMPACAGVALGFDRLMMAALGVSTLAEVTAFPFERA